MAAKIDLHLHSRYSDRSAEWLFRRFEFPDSYSDPHLLYKKLKEKGMTFITFTFLTNQREYRRRLQLEGFLESVLNTSQAGIISFSLVVIQS